MANHVCFLSVSETRNMMVALLSLMTQEKLGVQQKHQMGNMYQVSVPKEVSNKLIFFKELESGVTVASHVHLHL